MSSGPQPTLLAVPNVSEGRDQAAIQAIARAFDATLLDVHTDPDHNRTVFTLAGAPGLLAHHIANGARQAIASIDINRHRGIHPRIGALDVAPIVYLQDHDRGAACAEALLLADLLGHDLQLPVFLYGALAGGRARAEIRRGGPPTLNQRMKTRELTADFGPTQTLHPTAGATLVAARPPLVAFNVQLKPPATGDDAKRVAARIRENGEDGLTGVRAIGLWLEHQQLAQVSTNVEDHRATPLRRLVQAIARHAEPHSAELVGLAPRAAFDHFPAELPVANRRFIEDALEPAPEAK